MKKTMKITAFVLLCTIFLASCNPLSNEKTEKISKLPSQTYEEIKKTPESEHVKVFDQKNWKTYTNKRVGYIFKYPIENLTLSLNETIKYPTDGEYNVDLVQFATKKTAFGIRTYVGEGKGTIEDWIEVPGAPRAASLDKFEKITVSGEVAYQMIGEAFIYVLANGNVYEITAHSDIRAAKIIDEPLFEEWVSTIIFTK